MAAITNDQGINIGNTAEVLAHCLLKSHQTYLTLVDEGFSSDLYIEVGRTVRCLVKALADAGMFYGEGMDDGDTVGLTELEVEDQDV